MANTLRLEVVTPEGKTCSEQVDMVTIPGIEGEMGIYPQHVPLVTQIVPGQILIRTGDQERCLAVGPGFVEITAERVSVLTEIAVDTDSMDEAAVAAACKAAEKRLTAPLSEGDAAAANAAITRSIAGLRGRRRRTQ